LKEKKRLMPVSLDFVPKSYEIDFVGHVGNIVYVKWLEDLRFEWLEKYFPLSEQAEMDIAPVLLRTDIRYKSQIKLLDSPVKGTVWVEEMGRLKWLLGSEFVYDGKVKADALQTGIFVKLPDAKPIRTPNSLFDLKNK